MKKFLQTLGLVVAMAGVSGQAFADGGRHGWEQQRFGHNHGYNSGGHSGGNWVAPLIALGVAGAVWGAVARPAPTYVAPVVTYYPPQPAPSASYYCASAGQFYPNTAYCPEGWQLVQPSYR
jgi:hypothetical protein